MQNTFRGPGAQIKNKEARTVFRDIVKVVATDDDRAGHLRRHDSASEDAATDRNLSSEGALLVCSRGLLRRACAGKNIAYQCKNQG